MDYRQDTLQLTVQIQDRMHVGVVTGDPPGLFIGAAHNGVGPFEQSLDRLVVIDHRMTSLTARPLGQPAYRPLQPTALIQEGIR